MKRLFKFSFCLCMTTALISTVGCQTVSNGSDNLLNTEQVIDQHSITDNNAMNKDLRIISSILETHDGEIVSFSQNQETDGLNVNVCFYKSISQNGKHEIEQELSQATGKDIAIEISGRLYPPIGGLDETILENDPCIL